MTAFGFARARKFSRCAWTTRGHGQRPKYGASERMLDSSMSMIAMSARARDGSAVCRIRQS